MQLSLVRRPMMKMKIARFCLLLLAAIFLSSGKAETPSSINIQPGNQAAGGKEVEMKVKSKAFQDGEMIPKQYTCDGANISPPIAWNSVPEKAKSIALIADDPDAPGKTWVHW